MMADHWKSLANRLGAPGVDEPEADEVVVDEVPAPPSLEKQTPSRKEESQPIARVTSTPRDESLSFARALRDVEDHEPPRAVKESKEIPQPAPRPAPAEPVAQAPAVELDPKKQKKRSSWEKLAGMFNISIDRPDEPPAPPAALEEVPAKPVAAARSPSKPELSLFTSDDEAKPANPALDAMFADAPREKLGGWGSSRRKMVDDIGWENDSSASPAQKEAKPETASEPIARETPAEESAEETDVEAPRRGRRRRGRRGRGDEAPRSDREESKPPSEDRWGGNEIRSTSSDDAWDEPESFEIVSDFEAPLDEFSDEFAPELENVDDDLQPEDGQEAVRRSSRRRRRGRVRSRDESTDSDKPSPKIDASDVNPRAEARPRTRPQEDRPPRSQEDRPIRAQEDRPRSSESRPRPAEGRPREADRSTRLPEERRPRPADERRPRVSEERRPVVSEDEDSRNTPETDREASNGRRRRRRRPSETKAESNDRENDPVELNDDLGHEGDEPVDGDKHRNIPTWIDSLQSIIESNIENHRRNDSRGGGSRGRPRGGGGRR